MNHTEIYSALERVFGEVFEGEKFTFADTLSPENLKSWDSLGHIRLIAATEETFDVRFTIDEIQELTTVGKLVDCLRSRCP